MRWWQRWLATWNPRLQELYDDKQGMLDRQAHYLAMLDQQNARTQTARQRTKVTILEAIDSWLYALEIDLEEEEQSVLAMRRYVQSHIALVEGLITTEVWREIVDHE